MMRVPDKDEFWVVEGPYDVTTKQVIIAGVLMTVAWIGVGLSIGWWLWGQ